MHQTAVGQLPHARYAFVDGMVDSQVFPLQIFPTLPPWPIVASDESPTIVVGETHQPVKAREISTPDWRVVPERGLYTGVAIFGEDIRLVPWARHKKLDRQLTV